MPRTTLTKTTAPGSYPTDGVAVTFADADNANGNQFLMTGNDLVIARNTHGSTAKTVTITSQPNNLNRSKNITAESLTAGLYKIYGPFTDRNGWAADGYLQLTAEDTNIEFAVIALG